MANGNVVIVKVVTAVVFGSGLIGFMGKGIVDNNNRNVADHVKIREERIIGDEKNEDSIDEVKDIVTDIRIEQREQMTILRRLDK